MYIYIHIYIYICACVCVRVCVYTSHEATAPKTALLRPETAGDAEPARKSGSAKESVSPSASAMVGVTCGAHKTVKTHIRQSRLT